MKEGRLCLGVKGPVTIPKALKFGFFWKSLALERLCLFYLNLWQFHSFCLRGILTVTRDHVPEDRSSLAIEIFNVFFFRFGRIYHVKEASPL